MDEKRKGVASPRIWGVASQIGGQLELSEISAEIRAYQRGLASIWRPTEIRAGACRNKRRNKGVPTGIGLDFEAGRNKDWCRNKDLGVQK